MYFVNVFWQNPLTLLKCLAKSVTVSAELVNGLVKLVTVSIEYVNGLPKSVIITSYLSVG